MLRFKNVRDADLGVYTCRAQNGLGRAEAAMELSGNNPFITGTTLNVLNIICIIRVSSLITYIKLPPPAKLNIFYNHKFPFLLCNILCYVQQYIITFHGQYVFIA